VEIPLFHITDPWVFVSDVTEVADILILFEIETIYYGFSQGRMQLNLCSELCVNQTLNILNTQIQEKI